MYRSSWSYYTMYTKFTSQFYSIVFNIVFVDTYVRFRPKVVSDWPQMGQIRDFFRSDFRKIWRRAQIMRSQLKSPRFVKFGANLTNFDAKSDNPGCYLHQASFCLHALILFTLFEYIHNMEIKMNLPFYWFHV